LIGLHSAFPYWFYTRPLGISNSLDILNGTNTHLSQLVRKGSNFKLNPKAIEIASFLFVSSEHLSFYKKHTFVRAVVSLFKKANSEQIYIITKIIPIVKEQVSKKDFLILFENIINKHVRKDSNKIKLVQ
jgi:hypothetical protein